MMKIKKAGRQKLFVKTFDKISGKEDQINIKQLEIASKNKENRIKKDEEYVYKETRRNNIRQVTRNQKVYKERVNYLIGKPVLLAGNVFDKASILDSSHSSL